jgi:RNA polymerase sigma-70 factor, ECF subfamily
MRAPSGGQSQTSTPTDVTAVDEVVRRAQQGDVAAFESLYRAHSPQILALCRRMTGDERLARDLSQDAFVRAWERLPTFRGASTLGTWLHALAANVVITHLRGASRDALRMLSNDATLEISARTAHVDERLDLDSAVAKLPAGARTVFVLHDMHGYSHDEISQMTGIAPGTSRAQLWRARRALLRALEP